MVGIRSFPFEIVYFQGRTVSFRESTGWVQNISEFYEEYIIKVPYSKIVRITFSYCYQVLGKPQDTG